MALRSKLDLSGKRWPPPPGNQATRLTCYLHVGTHKTGTTSLQHFLCENAPALRAAGLHFPQAGRPAAGAGHHNLAWQLNGDDRFCDRFGTLADVVKEVDSIRAPAVCISSEDFEYLGQAPAVLHRLRAAFEQIGYNVVTIIYLRPQAGYAESLYAELVKHGYARTFKAYLRLIVRDGSIRFGRWRFLFDYDTLLDGFAAVFGPEHLIVRPYVNGRNSGSLSRDFLQTVCVTDVSRLKLPRSECHMNAGLSFAAVVQRYRQNLVAAGYALPAANVALPLPDDRRRFDPLRLADVEHIAQRFAAGNERIFRRYGASIACVSRRELFTDVVAALGVRRSVRHSSELFDVEPGADVASRRPSIDAR